MAAYGPNSLKSSEHSCLVACEALSHFQPATVDLLGGTHLSLSTRLQDYGFEASAASRADSWLHVIIFSYSHAYLAFYGIA